MMKWVVFAVVLSCLQGRGPCVHGHEQLTDIVQTQSGPVQGMVRMYNGSAVNQYVGIPYAQPPTGSLRFRKPIPVEPWNDTYVATTYRGSCVQKLYENDPNEWMIPSLELIEDCLQLNVYVPKETNNTDPKAVMVWIHGGGFKTGHASQFDGSYLALEGDVIVVTVNYRLGLFGFLSTEDEHARGNFGLWDQVLAIQWVSENIQAFGGNNSSICIFGESAGAFSVAFQTIMPINKGRFQRALSQSGVVYTQDSVAKDLRFVALRAAELFNCSTNVTNDVMLDCLREVPADDILAIQDEAATGYGMSPLIDGELITDHPITLLNAKESEEYAFFQSLDVMIGTNGAEGAVSYGELVQYEDKYNFTASDGIPREVLCDEVARKTIVGDNANGDISRGICHMYDVPGGTPEELGRSALNVFLDLIFVIPTVRTLDQHSLGEPSGNSYQYVFEREPSYPWIPGPPWLHGANHAGEQPFVFGLDGMYPREHVKPDEEKELSRQMMQYWTNFAKTGNPNADDDDGLPYWPSYDVTNRSYMNLDINTISGQHLYPTRVEFWTETVPHIIDQQPESTETD